MNPAENLQKGTLPPPPKGYKGWPWTDLPPRAESTAPDGTPWPRITIVTPSLNQGKFLEKAIRSIHGQGYPNLEHFVMDAGSSDESMSILNRYASLFNFWRSHPDKGQTAAINEGLKLATGEIFNWLNSDDALAFGSFFEIARLWKSARPHWLVGGVREVDETFHLLNELPPRVPQAWDGLVPFWNVVAPQPACFLSLKAIEKLGPFREDLHYRMDWEYYIRLSKFFGSSLRMAITPTILAEITVHPHCKSARSSDEFNREARLIWSELKPFLPAFRRWQIRRWSQSLEIQQAMARPTNGTLIAAVKFALSKPERLTHRFVWGALKNLLLKTIRAGRFSKG